VDVPLLGCSSGSPIPEGGPSLLGYDSGMTWEMLIIAVARVLGSLPVLRWAFVGALIALLTDLSDLFLMNLIHLGGVRGYQSFDKWLDQVYMLTFLVVAVRWEAAPRTIAVALYAYRLAGFAAFEITEERAVLIFFPNVFEVWFLLIAGVKQFHLDFRRSPVLVSAAVSLLGVKMFQEYALHVGRWLDGFTAVEAVEAMWNWLTAPLR